MKKKITTTYARAKQNFTKVTRVKDNDTIREDGMFYLGEKKQVLEIDTDVKTVRCTLDDGSVGESRCMNEDNFSELKGIKIAYIRAKIVSLQKELNELVK